MKTWQKRIHDTPCQRVIGSFLREKADREETSVREGKSPVWALYKAYLYKEENLNKFIHGTAAGICVPDSSLLLLLLSFLWWKHFQGSIPRFVKFPD